MPKLLTQPRTEHIAILAKISDTAGELKKSGGLEQMFILDAIQELAEQLIGIHDELFVLREDIAQLKNLSLYD